MKLHITILFVLIAIFGHSQETGKYLYKTYETDKTTLNYRILFPENFDTNKQYPLFLFLHGMGERGTDNETLVISLKRNL